MAGKTQEMKTFCRYVVRNVCRLLPLLFVVACAPAMQEGPPGADIPADIPKQEALAGGGEPNRGEAEVPAEEEELRAVIAAMGEDPGTEQYRAGRGELQDFLVRYPESRWKRLYGILIRLLDEREELLRSLQAYQQVVDRMEQERAAALQESNSLRQDLRQLQERLHEEAVRAQQEKEQLKRDLNLLKDLEVQRELREKSLR